MEEEKKVMRMNCVFCGKEFIYMSKRQIENNYYTHVGSCPLNPSNKNAKKILRSLK